MKCKYLISMKNKKYNIIYIFYIYNIKSSALRFTFQNLYSMKMINLYIYCRLLQMMLEALRIKMQSEGKK